LDNQTLPRFIKRIYTLGDPSLLLGGSLFLFAPRGISAVGSGLSNTSPAGWAAQTGRSWQLAIALLVYELFGLVFALIQVIRIIFMPDKHPVDVVLVFGGFLRCCSPLSTLRAECPDWHGP
jgi:hypothetical protein